MSGGPRKMTPRGQMTRSVNSGPAVMMMPNHIRATFMPNPPLKSIPPRRFRKKHQWTGVTEYLKHFEKTKTSKPRIVQPTPATLKVEKQKQQQIEHEQSLQPQIELYRKEQRECGGEYHGMNCYNTLFVGRLAYEVTERKLLREMESYGPVKDIKLVKERNGSGRSKYAFVEYENEEDMKRAYRAVDGMKIEGRDVVVDVERGHTVPTWLPRRLGGGLGGTRLGGKDKNIKIPGRYDPSRPSSSRPMAPSMGGMMDGPGGMGMGRGGGGPPPMGYGGGYDGGRGGGYRDGGPPGPYGGGGGGGGGGPPGPYGGGGGGPYGGGGGGGYGREGGGPPPRGGGGGGGREYGGGSDRGGSSSRHSDSGRKRRHSRSRSPDRRYAPRSRY